MMKKLLALLLVFAMLIPTLIACGGGESDPATDGDETTDEGGSTDEGGTTDPGTDKPVVDDTPTGTQTGLYTPTAQKQRETYEAISYDENGPHLIETVYVSEQVIIADIIVTPEAYGVDPTGVADSTAGIQRALDDAAADKKGGTVFLPAGEYLVTNTIEVPAGVVLQGDWQDPDLTSSPEYGTVILADITPLEEDELTEYDMNPLFDMLSNGNCNSGLIGLTVYYPKQDVNNVIPYGYTVYGDLRMVMLRDLTFINSYRGIGACVAGGGHELLQIENVRMTALSEGYQARESREIGYTVDLRISTDYWATASGKYKCPDAEALRNHCRENAVAMVFQRLDLNQYTDITIKGYHTAMLFTNGFWGIFYGLDIKDCVYGVIAEGLASQGTTIARADIEADIYAVANYAVGSSVLKLADVRTTGKGGIECAEGANLMVDNADDLSAYKPSYGSYVRPASNLYVAEVEEFDKVKEDASPAIQFMLDLAAETGGIVYIPAGIYSLYTPLNVPAGVELRGAMQIAVRDRSATDALVPGTVLLANVPDGDFITLGENAGVQGIRIYYSSYDASTALTYLRADDAVLESCVAIRGTASGVYVMNTVISGSFIGIDFTGCDNHLIKQTFGLTFNNFIRAGGKNGHIESVLCNQTFTMRHPFYVNKLFDEDYYVDDNWQIHANEGNQQGFSIIRDRVLRSYCDVVYLIDAENEEMNNVFMYGCHRILRTDHSSVVCYNVTSDWQSLDSMFLVENGSDVIAFNPLRTSGKSHEVDESSSLTLYNRVISKNYYEPTFRSEAGMEGVGEVINEIEIFDCDSTKNITVTGATINTDPAYVKEGSGSLKQSNVGTGAATEGVTVFSLKFDPIDASELGTENLYLHMWVYSENTMDLGWGGGNNIRLANTANGVGITYNWLPTSYIEGKSGWTELWLPLSSGWNGTDEMDLSSLQLLSFGLNYCNLPERYQFYVDDIYICSVLPYDETAAAWPTSELLEYTNPTIQGADEPMRVMIENCDTLDQIDPEAKGYLTLNRDRKYVKEGSASFKSTPGSSPMFQIAFPATDITEFDATGYLHMWMYIDNISNLGTNTQIELCSGGTYDAGEKTWYLTSYLTKSGWNELWIPLSSGSTSSTATVKYNPASVNYIRIYASHGLAKPTFYIDDVYICNLKKPELYNETNTDTVGSAYRLFELPVLNACEKLTGTEVVDINKKAQYVLEGKRSFKSLQAVNRFVFNLPDTDITEYMDDYLHFSIWVEDVSLLVNGQFELSSGATCDIQEICWNTSTYLTKNGWNEVYLPMSAPTGNTGGSFDPTRLNYIRIYARQTANAEGVVDMYIDDIRFVDKDDVPEEIKNPPKPSTPSTPTTPTEPKPEAPKPTGALVLLDGETLPSGIGQVTKNTDLAYVKSGSASYAGNAGNVRLTYKFDPLDVSGYKGGFLHLSIYVQDFEKMKGGYVELTSGGQPDTNEIAWSLATFIVNEGWNELWLPLVLVTPYATSHNGPDLSAVNYLRVYTNSAEGKFYIDDVYFSTEATGKKADEGKHVLFDGESVPSGMAIHGATTPLTVATDATYVKEGSGSILSKEPQVRLVYHFDALDISAYEGGYLHMWVYVTDYETIGTSGQIELTSSGECDINELGWGFKAQIKGNGWNELWLPIDLSLCSATTGTLNLKGVNYLRIFTIRSGAVTGSAMYFDDVYFTMTK